MCSVLHKWSASECVFMLVVSLLAALAVRASADGKTVFENNCSGCHTIGGGNSVGPDLKGVAQGQSAEWITRFIREPDRVIAEKDPIALGLLKQFGNVAMPNLGLSADDVAAVAGYLGVAPVTAAAPAAPAAAGAATAASTPVAASTPAGDADVGGRLFQGSKPLAGGGPQCMSCHSVAGPGILGGGALGPDLTPVFRKYGAQGLPSVLQTVAFPTMAPLYRDHPLTAGEAADITAFLSKAGAGVAVESLIPVLSLALTCSVVLYMLLSLLWRGRLRRVRESLLPR